MNTALEYSTRVVQEGGRRCKKSTLMVGSLKMNTTLEYSTRVVQEGDRRCKKSTSQDLFHAIIYRDIIYDFISQYHPPPPKQQQSMGILRNQQQFLRDIMLVSGT